MNYSKYPDHEIMDSYATMMDYSQKADDDILAEIQSRGGLEKFLRPPALTAIMILNTLKN